MLKFNGWKIIYFSTLFTMSTGGTTTNVDINNIDIPDEKVDSSENDNSGGDYDLISGVAGYAVGMECDVTPHLPDDHLLLILWYKIGQQSPIYTFDVRDRPMSIARVYSDQTLFDEPTRAVMNVTTSPAALIISKLIPADSGLYKCRVDFKRSPTKHALWNLTVIVPPHPPTIYSADGKRMADRLGPYKLGSGLVATCVNSGGFPPPRLSWWRDDVMIDDTYEEVNGQTINNLSMANITRRDQGALMQCKAANNDESEPAVTSLQLLVAYPTSKVTLSGPQTILAGDVATFSCKSHNVSGHSTFRWFIGNTELHDHTDSDDDGDTHKSMLRYSPSWEDDGLYLSCRSANAEYPDITREDGYILDIKFTPRAKIRFWRNLMWSNIHLGDDVYLECDIQANPAIYNVTWRHNGKRIEEDLSKGVIISNQTLVLQSVKLNNAGLYTCVASNVVADGESNALHLDIKFAPQCIHEKPEVVWASLGSINSIYCKTKSNPEAKSYSWKFHSSQDKVKHDKEFDRDSFDVDKQESRLNYRVNSDKDYGKLECWAENGAEGDFKPCVFIVTPSVRPGILSGCKMLNKTWDSLHIACRMSQTDIGLSEEQFRYVATVIDRSNNSSKVISFGRPEFNLSKLEPGTPYSIQLFAENKIGAGPAITLLAETQRLAEKRTAESKIALQTVIVSNDNDVIMIIIGIITAIVTVLCCIVIMMIIILRHRRRYSRAHDNTSLGSGHSSHMAGEADSLQSSGLVRSSDCVLGSSKHQRDQDGCKGPDASLKSGDGSGQVGMGSTGTIRSNNSSRQRLVTSNSKDSSYSHPSLERQKSRCSTGGSYVRFSNTSTLPRPNHSRVSEECLVLSCQVLHSDAQTEVFSHNHMLEPPSTFKDKCQEKDNDKTNDNDLDKLHLQNNSLTSTHL